MAGRGRRRPVFVEVAVVVAVAVMLTAAALPMVSRYVAEAEKKDARSDLKMLYASVEAYYTRHQDVPEKADPAIDQWAGKYAHEYAYTRYEPTHFEFVTKKTFDGVYLYIDERGTVEERGEPGAAP